MPDKPLIIEAPRQGIAPSPHVGFGDVRNIDINTVPGVAKLNNILAKVSTTAVTATVKWVVRDPVTNSGANFYAVDSAGDLYVSTNSGASFADLASQPTAGGTGQGMAIWKDYLFVARATAIDIYGPLSSSPTWTNGWAGLTLTTDSLWHPMLVSKLDGKLYIGSGRYIDSVAEIAGQDFDETSSSTYTATSQALTLPEDYRIKCLAELGNNLMIGTWMSSSADDITELKIADIFPWAPGDPHYGQPVQMNENGVNAMINIGGNLYILAGIDGKIYKSNGIQAWVIGQIPLTLADTSAGKYLEPYPGAIINFKGRLFFSMSSATANEIEDGVGIYSLMETSDGNILNLEHVISEEVYGSANPTIIGALLGVGRDQLIAGWRNNATYGLDLTTVASFAYTTDYSGYYESPLYQVGTYLDRRQFTKVEFFLAKELAASEGIQVKFRINLTDSFTTLGTYTTANIGTGVTSFHEEAINIPEAEQLQIRVELLGTSSTTPELKQIVLT